MPPRRKQLQQQERKSNGFATPILSSKDLSASLLLDLADRLDPPDRSIQFVTEEWIEPPDIVDWAHNNFIDPVTNKLVHLEEHQQRMLRIFFKLIWEHKVATIFWSEIKKSGKTTVAGLVGSYWATFVESPNEIITIANDAEQAQGRIYDAMKPTLKSTGWDVPDMKPVMQNWESGTKVRAIGTNYEGEAGANYGLTLWSELWAFRLERRKRLWDEMTQVPTRKYSIRWVETYAGFMNESDLLWDAYCKAFKDGKESQPLGVRIEGLEDLPVWFLEESKTIVYWSHDPRMPWQTEEFLLSQRNTLRPSTYRRLWMNEWITSAEIFIEPAQWDVLEDIEELNQSGDTRQLFLGCDASMNNDSTALSVATWNIEGSGYPSIIAAHEWIPQFDKAIEKPVIDLDQTIRIQIEYYLDNFDVGGIYYDAYQFHSIMTTLRKKYDSNGTRKLFVEFPQSSGRIESDQALYNWIVNRQLRRIKDPALRKHMLNATAEQTERGARISKEKSTQKIDLAVASSMACFGASVAFRPKRKFIKV